MKAMAFELNFNGSVEFQEGNIRGKKWKVEKQRAPVMERKWCIQLLCSVAV